MPKNPSASTIFAGLKKILNLIKTLCKWLSSYHRFLKALAAVLITSAVIYSENQKREQRRFADAVSFARIVISDKVLFAKYSVQAALLGFRSAWNVAIAEYMSTGPLSAKPKKIRFKKSLITDKMGKYIHINLSKRIELVQCICLNT